MMRSLFSGVSGLKSHQTRMDTIGNNVANVNTTGFKSSRTTFADTLSQTLTGASAPQDNLGGTNPKQIGLGVGVASIDLLFTDGSVQSTGKNTDLCLSGNGLFVVKQGNQTYYTRDGAFAFDAEGNYVLPSSGLFVQGWMGTDGVINTTGAATNIQIAAGKSMPSKATTTATYANNLNASALTVASVSGGTGAGTPTTTTTYTASTTNPVTISYNDASGTAQTPVPVTSGTYTVGDTYNGGTITALSGGTTSSTTTYPGATASTTSPVTVTMSDGTQTTYTSGTYTVGHSLPVTTTIKVYDSLGTAHSVPVLFEKNGTDNQWDISLAKSSITESDGSITEVSLTGGPITFTSSGKYDSGTATITLNYSNVGTTTTGTGSNGAADGQTVTLNLSQLTQYAGSSTINATPDGNAAGTLSSVSVDSSGIITGTYTNGVKQQEAQVAVAQFTNASGLTKTGNSLYQESNNSGTANVKTAADLGVTITPSALEMSNVDIANEFSDMIITQRGFQSNSKIITVGDEMLETVINMKR